MVRQYQEYKNNTKIIIEVLLPSTEPEEFVANKNTVSLSQTGSENPSIQGNIYKSFSINLLNKDSETTAKNSKTYV